MQDTVCEQDVSCDDAGAVHEYFAVDDGDGHIAAAESGDCAVGQRAAVGNGSVDDVVLKDGSSLLGGEVAQSRADVLECSVVGCKDRQVGCSVDGFCQVGGVDCTEEGTETSFLSGDTDIGRDGEKAVDDVDDTAVESDVLLSVNFMSRASSNKWLTA